MEHSDEKVCLCTLGRIFGFEPKTALALLAHSGSAVAIFRMNSDELDGILGPYSRHKSLILQADPDKTYRELIALEKDGTYYIGWTEPGYPELLKECEDAPTGLYIRSETPADELWKSGRSISVVGTRDISSYGREWCEKTVRGLADSGEAPLIVSGLALGTDIGGSATPIGASANVVGIAIAAQNGHMIGWGKYCKYLVAITIVVLLIGMGVIYVRYM